MKNLKRLSLALLLTTLLSVSFTSCIDTDVDPAVAGIYAAQADLIAAQTAVQNAEADYLAAQAAAEQADADYRAAQTAQLEVVTAGYEADNAYEAAQREQYLLQLVAQTNLQVAQSQNALALAQVQFDIDMAALMAELEAAGVQLAIEYAYAYAGAMNTANGIYSDLLDAQNDLANAELMQTGGVSYAYWLAMLEGNVTNAMAAKTAIEGAIADLEAYIANPSTPEAMTSALEAANEALQAMKDAKEIEMQVQDNKIMALYESDDVRSDVTDRIIESLDEHNDHVADKNDRLDWIEAAQDDIDDWQMLLDDYATAEATLQGIVDAAQIAYDDAVAAEALAEAADDTADTNLSEANTALTTLEGIIDGLEGTLQTAAINLQAAQSTYDAGIVAAQNLVTSTGTAVTTAQAGVTTALANYELWRDRFEGGTTVNGGFYWEDTTVTTAAYADLANDVLGIHTDASGTSSLSYVRVSSWANLSAAADDNVGDDYEPALVLAADLPAGNVIYTTGGLITDTDLANAYPNVGYTTEYFIEVGNDDVVYNNLVQMNLASTALGNEDIFDVAPTQGATLLGGTDAYSVLWDAMVVELNAIEAEATFGVDLAAKQLIYDDLKAVYENELDLLDAAQLAVDDAVSAEALTETAEDDAEDAVDDADDDLSDAEDDLDDFLDTTEEDLQDWIDDANADITDWNAEIDAIQPIIDAKYAVVAGMFADLDEAGVEYTFEVDADGYGVLEITNYGYLSSLDPDIHAAIIAEWQAYWALEQEIDALDFEMGLNDDLIDAYDSNNLGDLADDLEDLMDDLADAMEAIELAEQALASGQVEEDAAMALIGYYQALVDTLTQRHANALAIADEFEALMLAALGN